MKYSYEYKLKCVELYRKGEWPETPEGVSQNRFRHNVSEWAKLEESFGIEILRHKPINKKWSAEEKYELVSKVLAGASRTDVAFKAGISSGMLYQWVQKYKIEGYNGLVNKKKGRPGKENTMKKKPITPPPLTESEREELIRLRAENEYIKTENAVIKKLVALENKKAAQLKAKEQQSLRNSVKKDVN